MAGRIWNHAPIFFSVDHRIERLFDELIYEPWGHPHDTMLPQPSFEFYESSTTCVVTIDLPGLLAENVKVSVEANNLIIRGQRETAEVSRTRSSVCVQRMHGSFSRQFPLTSPVDANRISMEIENGLLRVTVPKQSSIRGS